MFQCFGFKPIKQTKPKCSKDKFESWSLGFYHIQWIFRHFSTLQPFLLFWPLIHPSEHGVYFLLQQQQLGLILIRGTLCFYLRTSFILMSFLRCLTAQILGNWKFWEGNVIKPALQLSLRGSIHRYVKIIPFIPDVMFVALLWWWDLLVQRVCRECRACLCIKERLFVSHSAVRKGSAEVRNVVACSCRPVFLCSSSPRT